MSTTNAKSVFAELGLPERPVMLAPLAGVSDHPFRRVCARQGADLVYVEMLSATALLHNSKRTYDMLSRHESERICGVQITGKTAQEVGDACAILDQHNFETIDINMGCPVTKVTKSGSGSAIMKEPDRVYETVKLAVAATSKPVSVKIRVGWDQQTVTFREVGQAAVEGGARWLTIHGRLRNNDYSVPVDLQSIKEMKELLPIPVLGNGNVFSGADARYMEEQTGVDSVMVSRGALGNPWVFREIHGDDAPVTLDEWFATVRDHLTWQGEEYGQTGFGAVCMRKHLLWYLKGWPGAKKIRAAVTAADDVQSAMAVIETFANDLARQGMQTRLPIHQDTQDGRFQWDPKYEMDRQLDRGVGHDGLSERLAPLSQVHKSTQAPASPA